MILIGMGANLPLRGRTADQTLAAALQAFVRFGIYPVRVSRLYHSPPKPHSGQPWFANCVAQVHSRLDAHQLLQALHGVERVFGRVRRKRWSARTLDLDLLAYHDQVIQGAAVPHEQVQRPFVVPHPALAERSFVLLPLQEVAPQWRHPVTGLPIAGLIRNMPRDPLIYASPPGGPFGLCRNAASQRVRNSA